MGDTWYDFNDAHCKPLERAPHASPDVHGYLLFYVRQDINQSPELNAELIHDGMKASKGESAEKPAADAGTGEPGAKRPAPAPAPMRRTRSQEVADMTGAHRESARQYLNVAGGDMQMAVLHSELLCTQCAVSVR